MFPHSGPQIISWHHSLLQMKNLSSVLPMTHLNQKGRVWRAEDPSFHIFKRVEYLHGMKSLPEVPIQRHYGVMAGKENFVLSICWMPGSASTAFADITLFNFHNTIAAGSESLPTMTEICLTASLSAGPVILLPQRLSCVVQADLQPLNGVFEDKARYLPRYFHT